MPCTSTWCRAPPTKTSRACATWARTTQARSHAGERRRVDLRACRRCRGSPAIPAFRPCGPRSRPRSAGRQLPAELVRSAHHRRPHRGRRDPQQLADPHRRRDGRRARSTAPSSASPRCDSAKRPRHAMARSRPRWSSGYPCGGRRTSALSLVIRLGTRLEPEYSLGIRPVLNLIDNPTGSPWSSRSVAGLVGVVSVTESRVDAPDRGVHLGHESLPRRTSACHWPSAVGAKRGGPPASSSSTSRC